MTRIDHMAPVRKTPVRRLLVSAAALAIGGMATCAQAADVTLNASDGFGGSSFNSAGGWSNGAAPSAGNNYLVDNGIRLRTPADGNSYTFAGDSLILGPNGTTGYNLPGGELMYKGTGTEGIITVGNLVLNGGSIAHANGIGDLFQLAGNVNVAADSTMYAKQGVINISAPISGSATITNPGSDGPGRTLILSSDANTFTGDIVLGNTANAANFELADGANLNFVIGESGLNNSVSGLGNAVFNGVFNFDLSGAGSSPGDSWAIATAATQTFGDTFSIAGFTETADIWTNGTYEFSEATGVLSVVVPEPGSLAIAAMGVLALLRRRRA